MRRKLLHGLTAVALAWLFWASAARPVIAASGAGASIASPGTDPASAPRTGDMESVLRLALARETAGVEGRVEIEFPETPTPPALSGCARVEPFVPPGARLWGRTTIGVRCAEGKSASAFIPVHVRVYAQALSARRPMPAGAVVAPEDLGSVEVEVSGGPGSVLADPREALGRTLARQVSAGTVLRPEHLRTRWAVASGDPVRLLYEGRGFTISADARALSQALEGQSVRVQTESGRILTGTARTGRVVEIRVP